MFILVPQISIIVPVYNTSKYLSKCLNSIIEQSVVDIEIVVINDCSTDNSLELLKKFAVKDQRIKLINKEINEGLELARKVGIDNAKGTYIYHVDSDDWLVPKTLDLLLREAIITDADIVVANFYRTLDGFGIIKQKSNVGIFQKRLISQKEFLNDYYKSFFGINVFQVSMCGKLYRREFLQNLDIELLGFDLGEDLNYNIQVFPKAKNILFLSDFVYNYRFGRMTTKFNDKLITAAVEMYAIKKKYTKEYNRDDLNRYIIIELKNFMRTHIEMLVKFKKSVTNEDHKRIIALLDNSEYTDVINFFATQDIGDDLFVKAMIKKDSEKLVQISAEKVRKEFIKDSVKKCISRLFAN